MWSMAVKRTAPETNAIRLGRPPATRYDNLPTNVKPKDAGAADAGDTSATSYLDARAILARCGYRLGRRRNIQQPCSGNRNGIMREAVSSCFNGLLARSVRY